MNLRIQPAHVKKKGRSLSGTGMGGKPINKKGERKNGLRIGHDEKERSFILIREITKHQDLMGMVLQAV